MYTRRETIEDTVQKVQVTWLPLPSKDKDTDSYPYTTRGAPYARRSTKVKAPYTKAPYTRAPYAKAPYTRAPYAKAPYTRARAPYTRARTPYTKPPDTEP